MTDTPTLTGQDIGEAQGAVTGLLDRIVAGSGSTSSEYIVLRVLAGRGPWASAEALRDYLAGQPQLGLGAESAGSLLRGLEARGLITASAPGPVQLTEEGNALLAGLGKAVAEVTARLYAGFGQDDLATAHRVLAEITERAGRLSAEP